MCGPFLLLLVEKCAFFVLNSILIYLILTLLMMMLKIHAYSQNPLIYSQITIPTVYYHHKKFLVSNLAKSTPQHYSQSNTERENADGHDDLAAPFTAGSSQDDGSNGWEKLFFLVENHSQLRTESLCSTNGWHSVTTIIYSKRKQ